ncbi:TPA: hypothetical protein ACQ340_000855 [Yersinia enterocolitica]
MNIAKVVQKKMSDGWTIKEILHPEYDGHNHYYYLGRRAPVVKVGEEKILKQYAGYTLIEKDLRSILVWLEEIEKINPGPFARYENPQQMDLVKGYFVAALTFYGKCFSESKGRGIKYDRSNIPEKYRKTHDIIITMRNNFTAHSGVGFENVKISLVLHPDINSNMEPKLYTELRQPDFIGDLIEEMVLIVKTLQNDTRKKRTAVGNKFLTEVVRPYGKLFWYQKGVYDEFSHPEILPLDD